MTFCQSVFPMPYSAKRSKEKHGITMWTFDHMRDRKDTPLPCPSPACSTEYSSSTGPYADWWEM